VSGQASVLLSVGNRKFQETVYLVEGLVTPLLGKPAIAGLDLIRFIDDVNCGIQWKSLYPKLFSGLGTMSTKVKINLKEEVEPFVQSTPRRIAAARKQPLKEELGRMVKMGVIKKIEEPTNWCAPCVIVPKKNNKLRVCIDFTRLNKAVRREFHPLPTSEETLSALGNAKVFTKLDANCGYWQMELEEESQRLTTFITPFGRYYCRRLPFGISSAPEIYQREMQKVLVGLEGVVCQMDDILVYGVSQEEHDTRLRKVLKKLLEAGITLNGEKCEFDRPEIKFLGHLIGSEGIKADPEKTQAIVNFPTPGNRKELRRFFGIVNYLGKFSASLSENSGILRQLLGKENDWHWSTEHEEEFQRLKSIMASTPTLLPFRLGAQTMLSADASSYGLGAAIFQQVDGTWKPVAYASRSLSPTEKRYAQIEKEALAICWACEKFSYFLVGTHFLVETDHKPLLAVLSSKELAKLPVRVQRFRLRMMAYCYDIIYTPGQKLVVADALSRSPNPVGEQVTGSGEPSLVLELISMLPISSHRLDRIKASMLEDEAGMILLKNIEHGWPASKNVEEVVKPFYAFREFLTSVQGIVYYLDRIYIPLMERDKILKDIHRGHQGETKCIRRAGELVWWPGMSSDIRNMVRECTTCEEFRRKPREPLLSTPLPERPWWRLAVDLFENDGHTFLVVVDYYSRYITAHHLTDSTDSEAVVRKLESLFCLLGIPNSIVSDNGPQFVSNRFRDFLSKWDITHVTSSPKYAQANGEAERAVQTVKGLMRKNVNIQAALCSYRDTPLANGYSPAQLLFGRPMNAMGIISNKKVDANRLKDFESSLRTKQEATYNSRHRARDRSPLEIGQQIAIRDGRKSSEAVVIATRGREVIASSESDRLLRRNRAQVSRKSPSVVVEVPSTSPAPRNNALPIVVSPTSPIIDSPPEPEHSAPSILPSPVAKPSRVAKPSPVREPSPAVIRTRSGRTSRAPNRLNL